MRSSTNNFRSTSEPTRRDSTYASNNNNRNYRTMPQFVPSQASLDANRGAHDFWQPVAERAITVPSNLAGFPLQPLSPMQILLLNNGILVESLPGFMGLPNVQASTSTQQHDSRLTQDEQRNALKKLKKEIYNPIPKKLTSRLSFYYRDNAMNVLKERAKEKEEDGKRCAVCLEDFEPKESVMLTPCDHMFHEDCIVPWVKSHGQCPVCRFVICQPVRTNAAAPLNNNNIANIAADDLLVGQLISIAQAMEEAYRRHNATF